MKSIIFLFKVRQSVVSYPAGCFSVVFVFFVVYLLTLWLNRNLINPSSPWSRGLGSQVLGDLPINQFNGIQYCAKVLFQSPTTVLFCSVDHWQISQHDKLSLSYILSWQFWASGQCLHCEINPQGPHNGIFSSTLIKYKQQECENYLKIKFSIVAFAETCINYF